MRVAQPKRKMVVGTASIPAPTGGLNAKDAIANMKDTEAVIMTNWFPTPSSVDVRNGYANHVTGVGSPTETLMTYNLGATKKLFGIAGGSIYDMTSAGAVGAASVTGLTNSRFQSCQIGTAGGYFLMAVNGEDKLQGYDGTNWWEDGDATHDITGVDTATISHINNFKNRIWLIQKNTLKVWYLPVSSIAGAASALDLSALFKLGGYIMAMANWTIDNANGIDDYAAFITSEGEVALYEGTNPASASTWNLVGTFRMGRPIGRRCVIKVASDVLVLTTDGAYPLSKSLLTDRSQSAAAVSDKIVNLLKDDIKNYSAVFGWEPFLYPFGNKMILNVPTVVNDTAHQYVMNTMNGSWCKFTGWNANCFAELNDVLYFGGNTAVYAADTGDDDNGSDIQTDVQQAFSYFGSKGQQKKFTMVRPIFLTTGDINPAVVLNTNFGTTYPVYGPSFSSPGGALWDVATWDVSSWGVGETLIAKWQSVTGVGYCGGLRVATATQGITVRWVSTDFAYEKGGVL